MVSISVCEREEGALKCTNTNREGDGRAARSGGVGAPGQRPADGGRVRFERSCNMLTNLLAKCICTPILGEWYSSVGKKRGRHNNDFGLLPARIDLDGASFDSDGACFDFDGARKRTFAPACCIEKCEIGGGNR